MCVDAPGAGTIAGVSTDSGCVQARGSGTNEENAVVVSATALYGGGESGPGKPAGCEFQRGGHLSSIYNRQRCPTDRNLWIERPCELPVHADSEKRTRTQLSIHSKYPEVLHQLQQHKRA